MTDNTPMQLEKYYTCCIEKRWHVSYNPASARLPTGLLVQCLNSTQDRIDDGSGGSDIGM